MTLEAQLSRLDAMIGEILRKLNEPKPQGPLTRKAFGKLVGLSARTVSRRIEAKEILTKGGLIPFSEARKFLS